MPGSDSYYSRSPSHTRRHYTSGSTHYPDGYPRRGPGRRSNSSEAASSSSGRGYPLAPSPFTPRTPIEEEYNNYKELQEAYGYVRGWSDDAEEVYTTSTNWRNGNYRPPRMRDYTPEAHEYLSEQASNASIAALEAATARLNFEQDHIGRLPYRDRPRPRIPREGHREQIDELVRGHDKMHLRSRQHEHWARGGDGRQAAEILREHREASDEAERYEYQRNYERQRAREQFNRGEGLGGGRYLPNGRREYISTGGGRRRYYDSDEDDYVDYPNRY